MGPGMEAVLQLYITVHENSSIKLSLQFSFLDVFLTPRGSAFRTYFYNPSSSNGAYPNVLENTWKVRQ